MDLPSSREESGNTEEIVATWDLPLEGQKYCYRDDFIFMKSGSGGPFWSRQPTAGTDGDQPGNVADRIETSYQAIS